SQESPPRRDAYVRIGPLAVAAPADGVQQQPLISRIAPDCLLVSERRVEHAPLAVGAGPGQRPAIRSLVHTLSAQVYRLSVKTQENPRSLLVEIPDLIDLVLDLKRGFQEGHQSIRRFAHVNSHALMPGMTIEISADERTVVGPFVKRVGGGVHAYKATPRANEIEERSLLCRAHRQLAGRVEHHSGIASEVFSRKLRDVLSRGDIEQP